MFFSSWEIVFRSASKCTTFFLVFVVLCAIFSHMESGYIPEYPNIWNQLSFNSIWVLFAFRFNSQVSSFISNSIFQGLVPKIAPNLSINLNYSVHIYAYPCSSHQVGYLLVLMWSAFTSDLCFSTSVTLSSESPTVFYRCCQGFS